jgi:hypothetical protein
MPHKGGYGMDYGDRKFRDARAGDSERRPLRSKRDDYHGYEKNETYVEDNVMKPGPVLAAAMGGKMKKGKRPKGVMSAAGVADTLAKAWKL